MAEVEMTRQSRLGKRPIPVPKGVKVAIADGKCDVQGPKGKLSIALPENVIIDLDDDAVRVRSDATDQDAPRLQGLARALIAKMCIEKQVQLVVFDRNGNLYHGRIKALAEAAREAGLQF